MTSARRVVAIAVALASTGPAAAGEYWIEGPVNAAKSAASAQATAGEKAGLDARVVRRYVEDQGWRYVVVAEEWSTEDAARKAASGFASAISAPVAVFSRDGRDTEQIAVVEAGAPAPAAPPPESTDPEVARLLARAVAAHGGPEGGRPVIDRARTVRFEYERVLEGGLKVRHTYLRDGLDQSLVVRVVEGSGIDSETRLVAGSAWLQTGKEAFSTQDAERARELLAQASPAGIVPFVLVLGTAAGTRPEFARLERGEPVTVGGVACDVLRFVGDRASGPMSLGIDQKDGRVRQISFEDGDLVHQFDSYDTVAPGLVVPKKITTWKEGKLVETTTVTALELDGAVPAGALQRPAP